jgi:transcriptional regulator with XRE-family HTH domain
MATLKELRFEAGLTLSQIAKRAGVATSTVSRAEEGQPVQELKAYQIAKALSELLRREIKYQDIEGLNVY